MTEMTRRIATIAFGAFLVLAAAAAPVRAQETPVDTEKPAGQPAPDERRPGVGKERPAGEQKPADQRLVLEEEGTIDPEASRAEYNTVDPGVLEDLQQLAVTLSRLGQNSHRVGGSFTTVPAPGWRADGYDGYFRNSFRVARGIRLGANVSYGQTNVFKDGNFPNSLYRAGASLSLTGQRFTVMAAATNRADGLFRSLDDVSIAALATGAVYRKGPHSVILGGVYTSRNDVWNLVIPMPLLAYRYTSRSLVVNVGLPFFLLWRPSKSIILTLAGMLPGVGSFQLTFRAGKYVSIGGEYTHTKESYFLSRYPHHDWRYVEHELRRVANRLNPKGQFFLDVNTTGVRLTVTPDDHVSLFVFAGMRLGQSYYYTTNVLSQGDSRTRIPTAFVAKGGLECRFWSGKAAER